MQLRTSIVNFAWTKANVGTPSTTRTSAVRGETTHQSLHHAASEMGQIKWVGSSATSAAAAAGLRTFCSLDHMHTVWHASYDEGLDQIRCSGLRPATRCNSAPGQHGVEGAPLSKSFTGSSRSPGRGSGSSSMNTGDSFSAITCITALDFALQLVRHTLSC